MMSFTGELRHTPAATKLSETLTSMDSSDPLQNLSAVQARVDTLQKFLHNSVNSNTLIGKEQMEIVSGEIATAIHQIIINGAALLASIQTQNNPESFLPKSQTSPNCGMNMEKLENPRVEEIKNSEDYEIIEIDAVELLAEHIHFCEICGKGFKRDANLRMHMRAHGDQFKTLEALAKPDGEKNIDYKGRRTRFSCPFVGCNRNKQHKKFRPLKSVICVKNHFKRSHCPKMYSCTRCNKKNFSVLADLKSHLKHCGEVKWKCSCGTNFSRKDKLFGHMALFEGHMPAVTEEEAEMEVEEGKGVAPDDLEVGMGENGLNFEGLLGGFESTENYDFQDVFSPSNGNGFFSY